MLSKVKIPRRIIVRLLQEHYICPTSLKLVECKSALPGRVQPFYIQCQELDHDGRASQSSRPRCPVRFYVLCSKTGPRGGKELYELCAAYTIRLWYESGGEYPCM
ncbi:hypothetical protein GDO81_010626 [Engystomops pustulosus]|uniref:Uncharacterized protein n=1 Tax=Engystomops pustulosus TaxID=76066 RepID=A0AAV7C285_ENGPU|nr:hypothetical protein GDO81_010626 [Engystomops pustulosus]